MVVIDGFDQSSAMRRRLDGISFEIRQSRSMIAVFTSPSAEEDTEKFEM